MALFGPDYPTLQRGIVNLKSGSSFRGVIWQRKGGYLTLRNAELLRAKNEVVEIVGEVAIPERDIEFIQLPGEVL
ncbi:MAG: hypothetical protein V2A73_16905 [Pseudomonadota bacterium]